MERQLALSLQQKLGISVIQIVREEYEMLLLNRLVGESFGGKLVFRGGTALRLAYNSPRFSDDLDFSCLTNITEKVFKSWCKQTARSIPYLRLDEALRKYFTLYAMFKVKDPSIPETISIKVEISTRRENWLIERDYQLLTLRSAVTPITVLAQVASLAKIEREKQTINPPRIRDIFDLWFIGQLLKKDHRLDFSSFSPKEVKRELHRMLAAPHRRLLEPWLPKE